MMRALFLSMLCIGVSVSFAAMAEKSHCMVRDLGLPLAGEGVVDCGIADAGKPAQGRRVVACARKAIERGQPVRFGNGYFGTDAFGCDVIVVDGSRMYWRVTFDWDLSVPDDQPKSFVGHCPAIDLDSIDMAGTSPFAELGCVFDEDAFKRAKIRRP
ncbi:MAG: hypothetical protein KF800_01160 [Lysobacter sp.]|nr:hypothetical protein [Lysobacter sp.]